MAQESLYDLAKVIRSKNSGPFQITLDVLFDDEQLYHYVKDCGVITPDRVASLYGFPPERIQNIVFLIPRWESRSPLTGRSPRAPAATGTSTALNSIFRSPRSASIWTRSVTCIHSGNVAAAQPKR